jgi:putative PIN family toxin of toxin-antitoxin system
LKVVLDTNVLLVSISPKSRFRPIFDSFLSEDYELCVTTDILMEYEEVFTRHMGAELADYALQLIENAPNIDLVTRYYKWNLIKADPDDNKFVDCAVAGNAKFIVSDDKHFEILKQVPFPKIDVLKAKSFLSIVNDY